MSPELIRSQSGTCYDDDSEAEILIELGDALTERRRSLDSIQRGYRRHLKRESVVDVLAISVVNAARNRPSLEFFGDRKPAGKTNVGGFAKGD